MASRNPHAGEPRPGPSRVPEPADRRISMPRERFPCSGDSSMELVGLLNIRSSEHVFPYEKRFKDGQYCVVYGIKKESQEKDILKREARIQEYIHNPEVDKEWKEAEEEKRKAEEEKRREKEEMDKKLLLVFPLCAIEPKSKIKIVLGDKKKTIKKEVDSNIKKEIDVFRVKVAEVENALKEVKKEEEVKVSPDSPAEPDESGQFDEIYDPDEEWMKLADAEPELLESLPNWPVKNQKPPPGAADVPAGHIRLYKVMYDPTFMQSLKTKDFVRRFNGKCGEKYKQFDYNQAAKDPRVQYRKIEQPKDLRMTSMVVDDNFTGIPPQREVTVYNLNDNVNEKFLRNLIMNQKLVPEEVIVFYHPATKKHLAMALVLFQKSRWAREFVETNNGTSLMGSAIICTLDPFAAELSAKYLALVGQPLPPLKYLSAMSEHELSLRREKITGRIASPQPEPPKEIEPVVVEEEEFEVAVEKQRSLTPMEMETSPPIESSLPPPPPMGQPWLQQPVQQAFLGDTGLSTSMMASPPPPYSELPPSNHEMHREERRAESRTRSIEPEGRARREKRRHQSTSSSSSGEGHSKGSKRRKESGVKKKKVEYYEEKKVVSSERDSNGSKHISIKKSVTYKYTTEHRIGQKSASPDSFDEEMQRRERNKRNAETRGKDEMRWSTPSSDSDNGRGGGSRRKKTKREDRSTASRSREDQRRTANPSDSIPPTPSRSTVVSSSSSRRSTRFDSAPIFDPTQPPPAVVVPPVGVVTPDCSLPPPPPLPSAIPLPPMMVPPPPLPGGFIPPPEFFGLQSTPAMLCAASAAVAAGLPPLPLPPPPMMVQMSGYTTPGYATPLPTFGTPTQYGTPRPVKMPHKPSQQQVEEGVAAGSHSLASTVSSPSMTSSGLVRAASNSSLAAAGRTPVMATPPTSSDGGNTPLASAAATAAAEKKANLDDRLSQLFGLTKAKAKKEEEAREMKHAASAPSFSAMDAEPRMRDDDDMDIEDDDMDVASSSSGEGRGGTMMEKRGGEDRETEEERRHKEEADRRHKEETDRRRMEEWVDQVTKKTLDQLVKDLEQQIGKDLQRKLETSAFQVLEEWEKKQKNEEEEKKKQIIRDSLAASAARVSTAVTPQKDPMEMMISPNGGISNFMKSIKIVKRKDLSRGYSRDGTPVSRDSRGQSRTKSRSASRSTMRSRSSSSNEGETRKKRRERSSTSDESSSESDEDEGEDEVRKGVKKRPSKRNLQSTSQSSYSSDNSEDDEEKENERKRRGENDSPMIDDVDVIGMSEDEVEEQQKAIVEEEPVGVLPPSTPVAAAAATSAAEVKAVEELDEDEEVEGVRDNSSPAGTVASWTSARLPASTVARVVAQRELLRQMESMRPDPSAPYHPVRYDHPYVRQLGVPFEESHTILPPAVTQLARNTVASHPIVRGPPQPAVALAVTPVQPKTGKAARKSGEGDKVPQELLSLLPTPVPKRKTEKEKERLRRSFKKRSEEEEAWIADSFKAGMDEEDENFVKRALEEMQKDGARPFGREIEFESHLRAYTPLELLRPAGRHGRLDIYLDDLDLAGVVPHPAGCARAQGFYRLPNKQRVRIVRRPEEAFQDRTEINERDEIVTRHQVQAQKEQRSMNRRLQTMVDSNPNSEFFKVNQLKYRKKMIKFARSRIHGWGLYALEPIAPDDMIVEYIGQKIRPIVADEREKAYERRGIGSSYLFRIDEDEVIDATRQGNFARFINHSCQPNCYAKVVTVDGDKRIVIYSKTLIQKGDEITYDYKFPIEDDKIECLCGAPLCRGTLN